MYLSAKTGVDPETLIPALRAELRATGGEASIYDVAGMETRLSDGLRGNRFRLFLVSAFAVLAVLRAAAGVYGAIAFSVAQRAPALGVVLSFLPAGLIVFALAALAALLAAIRAAHIDPGIALRQD